MEASCSAVIDKLTSEAVLVITTGVISSPNVISCVAGVTSIVTEGFTVMVNVLPVPVHDTLLFA